MYSFLETIICTGPLVMSTESKLVNYRILQQAKGHIVLFPCEIRTVLQPVGTMHSLFGHFLSQKRSISWADVNQQEYNLSTIWNTRTQPDCHVVKIDSCQLYLECVLLFSMDTCSGQPSRKGNKWTFGVNKTTAWQKQWLYLAWNVYNISQNKNNFGMAKTVGLMLST